MKARITIELECQGCQGRLNYHKDSKVVKCGTLKCKMRDIEFHSPSLTLEPVIDTAAKEKEAKTAATVAKRKATMEANKVAKEADIEQDESAEG
jgi:hypothetical protein